MKPLSVVASLFWVSLLVSSVSLVSDEYLRKMLRKHWKILAGILVLTLVWRVPQQHRLFFGLEYEDSYVYTEAGRQLFEGAGPPDPNLENPLSLSTCNVGSLKSCEQWASTPEHLIGYPYLISLAARSVGYWSEIGVEINGIAACFAGIFIFAITLDITGSKFAAGASGIIFATIPVFAVYGLEASAEPALNACITVCIWFYLRLVDVKNGMAAWKRYLFWFAYTLLLLISQTVKREGLLLGLSLVLVSLFALRSRGSGEFGRRRVLTLLFLSTAASLIFAREMKILNTSAGELELLARYPPGPAGLALLVFGFARSFFVFSFYLFGGVLAIIGVFRSLRKRALMLVVPVVAIAYALLYAFHIRSFYQMRTPNADPWTALRFSMSFMSLFSILAGIGSSDIWSKLQSLVRLKRNRKFLTVAASLVVAACLCFSYKATSDLREDVVNDERQVRFEPALALAEHGRQGAENSEYLLTFTPLVTQLSEDPNTKVVDLHAVTRQELEKLYASPTAGEWLWLDTSQDHSDANEVRYREVFSYLQTLPRSTLERNQAFAIRRIARP